MVREPYDTSKPPSVAERNQRTHSFILGPSPNGAPPRKKKRVVWDKNKPCGVDNCKATFSSKKSYYNHRVSAHGMRLFCTCTGCSDWSTKSWTTFGLHCSNKHPGEYTIPKLLQVQVTIWSEEEIAEYDEAEKNREEEREEASRCPQTLNEQSWAEENAKTREVESSEERELGEESSSEWRGSILSEESQDNSPERLKEEVLRLDPLGEKLLTYTHLIGLTSGQVPEYIRGRTRAWHCSR
jgi:hypothetical protein